MYSVTLGWISCTRSLSSVTMCVSMSCGGGLHRQRADDVVRLVALGAEDRDVERLHHLQAAPDLAAQVPARLHGRKRALDLEPRIRVDTRRFGGADRRPL